MVRRMLAQTIRDAYEYFPDETREVLSRVCDERSLSRLPDSANRIASEIYEVMKDNLIVYKAQILPDDFVDITAFLFCKAVEIASKFTVRTWCVIDWHGIENGEWSFWFTCLDLKDDRCLIPEIVRLITFRKPQDFLKKLQEVQDVITSVRKVAI